jgi:hypothetical protein
MEQVSQSFISIKVVESNSPQHEVWREVFGIQSGAKVRLYVGSVKPTLPLPTLSQIPMYWEMWDNNLEIQIIAADELTLACWEYFRELSMAYITRGNR